MLSTAISPKEACTQLYNREKGTNVYCVPGKMLGDCVYCPRTAFDLFAS
jgi:hypothetical protein